MAGSNQNAPTFKSQNSDFDERHIRVRIVACQYKQELGEDGRPCSCQAIHEPIADQVTRFLDDEDAWPISQSLCVHKDWETQGERRVTHLLTLMWVPRETWESMQEELMANSLALLEMRKSAYGYDEASDDER